MTNETLERPLSAAEIDQLSRIQEGGRFAEDEKRLTRNPHTGRIVKSPDYGADDQLIVNFTVEPRFSKVKTLQAGGVPQYVDVEMVTIYAPGQKNELSVHTEVTDFYQWRFPNEYAAFKAGREAAVTGIPLIHWPEISPSLLKELEYHGIRTVEQVSSLPESVGGSLRGLRGLKPKAIAFLERAKDIAATNQMDEKLEAQRQTFEAELAAMRSQMEELLKSKAINRDDEPSEDEEKPKKHGYKKKE